MMRQHCNINIHRGWVLAVLMVFAAVTQADSVADQQADEIVFGVLPISNTEKIFTRFSPLADQIATATGKKVRLETAPDYATFVKRTNEKRYDVLFTAPHFYYAAQREAGYRVIVRINSPNLQAIFVVPKQSKIKTLQDLRGKTLSTTDPLALATVMLLNHLRANGIEPDKDLTVVPTPNHNASMLSAHKGITDAGGLMYPPYRRARPEVRDALRIIAMTGNSPHMPIAVAESIDAETAEKIKQALVNMGNTKAGRDMMKKLRWPGFVPAEPSLYDQMQWSSALVQSD